MAGTKKKNSNRKASAKPHKQAKADEEAYNWGFQHAFPQDRLAATRPFWETLTEEQRSELLTVDLDELRVFAKYAAARAKIVADAEAEEALRLGQVILSFDSPLDEVLEEGLARSSERGTWKIWHWPPEGLKFYDSDTFRKYLHENLLSEELLAALPREAPGAKIPERPAEAGLRQRMTELQKSVTQKRTAHEEAAQQHRQRSFTARRQQQSAEQTTYDRDIHVDLIIEMMTALEHEHEFIYHHVLHPVCAYVCEALLNDARKSTLTELHYEDLEHVMPDDIARLFDFIVEKVDAFTSRLKPDPKDLEAEAEEGDEDPIGDVDLFALINNGTAIRVNDKWLEHLQSRVIGEDAQPRRVKQEEDPEKFGLVLEWLYGTIVSTAEKARDAAHRPLGTHPTVEQALNALKTALEEQSMWEGRAMASRELLVDMLSSRKEAAVLAEIYDMRVIAAPSKPSKVNSTATPLAQDVLDGGEGHSETSKAGIAVLPSPSNGLSRLDDSEGASLLPPDDVIISVLKRETLLTSAKLHFLEFEHLQAQRTVRSLTAQLRQGEPQFERLHRELDELKATASRSLDGSSRSATDVERARKQRGDAAIEDQIHAQTEFRQTGARLQKILDTRREVELALARQNTEIAQLTNWRNKVIRLIMAIEEAVAMAAPLQQAVGNVDGAEVDEESGQMDERQRALVAAVKSATHQEMELSRLRHQFRTEVCHQLYHLEDDIALFGQINRQLKEVSSKVEDGRAALQHLEAFVLNVSCDDPGIAIGINLILPFIQQKLDSKALEFASQKANAALDEVTEMELKDADRQRLEKEKKARAKQKAREKARNEKERERAEREARELAAKASAEAAAREAALREAEAKHQRAEELERLRQAEEELMERRRQELLAQEGSYWKRRLEQDDLVTERREELEEEHARKADANGSSGSAGEELDDGFVAAPSKAAVRRSKPVRETTARETKARGGVEKKEKGRLAAGSGATADGHLTPPHVPRLVTSSAPVTEGTGDESGSECRTSTPPLKDSTAETVSAPLPLAPCSPDRPESVACCAPPLPQPHHVQGPTLAPHHRVIHTSEMVPMPMRMGMAPQGVMSLPLPQMLPPGAVVAPPPPPPHGSRQTSRSPVGDDANHMHPRINSQVISHGAYSPVGPGFRPPPPSHHHMMIFPPGGPGPQTMPPQMLVPGGAYMPPYGPGTGMPIPPSAATVAHMGLFPMRLKAGGAGAPPGMREGGHPSCSSPKQLRANAAPFVPSIVRPAPPPPNTYKNEKNGNGCGIPGAIVEAAGSSALNPPALADESSSAKPDTGCGNPSPAVAATADRMAFGVQQKKLVSPGLANGSTQQGGPPQAPDPAPPIGQQVDVRKLRLTKGLTNAPGLYNCFLNVIIQSLWHLSSVRVALLALCPPSLPVGVPAKSSTTPPSGDALVLSSLLNVFKALNNEPSKADRICPETSLMAASAPVSPRELREALSSSQFELSDMHDAAEVFEELLNRLHCAEAAPGSKDPTLPERLRVAMPHANSLSPPQTITASSSPPGAWSVWGDQAALRKVRRAPGSTQKGVTTASRLFGIEVQVPSGETQSGCSPGTIEVLQYVKYLHLVPSKGLLVSALSAPDFETALLQANGQVHSPSDRLINHPQVFTLSVVWDAPQVPPPVLEATFAVLKPTLNVSRLFIDAAEGLVYRLRCVVCYSSSHYCVFALSDEAMCWLLLDDANVSVAGTWADVSRSACNCRLQPSLLFYELEPMTQEE